MGGCFPGYGVFVCLFSYVCVAHIAEDAAVHLAGLQEIVKQIIKILYGVILLAHVITIHRFS